MNAYCLTLSYTRALPTHWAARVLLKKAQLSAARSHKLCAFLQESDADGRGGYTSHFELYMDAMQQAGAHVGLIHAFVAALAEGKEAKQALQELGAPLAVQHFVGTTLDIAENGTTAEVLRILLLRAQRAHNRALRGPARVPEGQRHGNRSTGVLLGAPHGGTVLLAR